MKAMKTLLFVLIAILGATSALAGSQDIFLWVDASGDKPAIIDNPAAMQILGDQEAKDTPLVFNVYQAGESIGTLTLEGDYLQKNDADGNFVGVGTFWGSARAVFSDGSEADFDKVFCRAGNPLPSYDIVCVFSKGTEGDETVTQVYFRMDKDSGDRLDIISNETFGTKNSIIDQKTAIKGFGSIDADYFQIANPSNDNLVLMGEGKVNGKMMDGTTPKGQYTFSCFGNIASLYCFMIKLGDYPLIGIVGDTYSNEGDVISFLVRASDADSADVAISAESLPAGAEFDSAASTFTWNTTDVEPGVYNVKFTASDGKYSTDKSVILNVAKIDPRPGVCYFGDSNGDCAITGIEMGKPNKKILLKPVDCTGVMPSDCSTLDVNGNGIVDSMDGNLLRAFVLSKTFKFDGKPASIVNVDHPASGSIGSTYDIKIKVTDADGTPRPGIGVLFTMDPSSTASAELYGRDPDNGKEYTASQAVFEMTDKVECDYDICSGGEAMIKVTPKSAGTMVIKTYVPGDSSKGISDFSGEDIVINVPALPVLDNAPVVQILSPQDGITLTTNNISIQYIAVDDLSSELSCAVFTIMGEQAEQAGERQTAINNTVMSINFTDVPNGQYTWNVACADERFNIGMNTVNFTNMVNFTISANNTGSNGTGNETDDGDDDDQGDDNDDQGNNNGDQGDDNGNGDSDSGGSGKIYSSRWDIVSSKKPSATGDSAGSNGAPSGNDAGNGNNAGQQENDAGIPSITGSAVAEPAGEGSSLGRTIIGILLVIGAVLSIALGAYSLKNYRIRKANPTSF